MVNFVFGDFIARLNIAKRLHSKSINIKITKLNLKMLLILKKIGLIRGFKFLGNMDIEVLMKYKNGRAPFKNLKVLSIPSKRVHIDLIKLQKFKDNKDFAIYIISTNKGLKTDFECFFFKLSGEVLLKIEF